MNSASTLFDPPADSATRRNGGADVGRDQDAVRRSRLHVLLCSDALVRCVNLAAAGLGLILAAPLIVLIAVLVKLTSPGPLLYTQTRVGLNRRNGNGLEGVHAGGNGCRRQVDLGGKPFKIYKFRSMHHEPRQNGKQVWAQPDDPRVTAVGGAIRKSRLDEIPQLVNVLRGEMSVVGPRPEQPKIFADLRERIQGYEARQRVRPGITGRAQVSQAYDTCFDDVRQKLDHDLDYIARRSVTEDLTILLRTVPIVLFRRGAM